jgi:DNA-binding beta-propeller fold protein YncE
MSQRIINATRRKLYRQAVAVMLVSMISLLEIVSVHAQQNNPLPEGATVSALGRTALVRDDGSFIIPNVPSNIGRFRVRLVHPDGRTAESEGLTPVDRGTTIVPSLVFGPLTPLSSSLSVTSSQSSFTNIGQTAQLSVTGNLQGGGTADLTSDLLTTYFSSNSSFATVNASGLVTVVRMPINPATLIITIMNEGVVGTSTFLLNPSPTNLDADNDGMPNDWELRHGFDPTNPGDAAQDADNDGLTNLQEYQRGAEPRDPDTDRDGISDGSRDPDGAGPIIAGPDPDPLRPETVPPTCMLTSPASGTTFIEGESVTLRATATDNVGVSRVTFTSNAGGLNFIDLAAPYEVPFVIPTGINQVTLSAVSRDIAGNMGTCPAVTVNVIPDPQTTVNGRVIDTNMIPVANASVNVLGHTSMTIADGTFSIQNVPTIQGNLLVNATFTQPDMTVLVGTSLPLAPVRGGTTNAGDITVRPRGRFALVTLGGGTAAVIDLSNNSIRASLTTGATPSGATVTPDGRLGIIANFNSGTLTFIDLSVDPPVVSGTLNTSPGMPAPESLAVTPDGRFGILADGGSTHNVIAVDLGQRSIISTVSSLPGNQGVAITPDGTQALVLSADTRQVSVLTIGANGSLTDTGQRVTLAGIASGARCIAITPDGRRALVTDSSRGLVTILGINNGTVTNLGSIGNLGTITSNNTSGVAIALDGKKAYVSSYQDSKIAVLSIDANDDVTDTGLRVSIPNGTPNTFFGVPGLAVTPDGTRLFINGYNNGKVSLLDTSTDMLLPVTITVGTHPMGIGMAGSR